MYKNVVYFFQIWQGVLPLITDPLEIEHKAKNIDISLEQLASMIDHTKLKPYEVRDSIRKLCEEANKYGFAAIYVHPTWVPFAKQQLKDTDVKVGTVISFPLGSTLPEIKDFEAKTVLNEGADELDMVINIGALREENYQLVEEDIKGVVEGAKEQGAIVKVILEVGYLTDEQVIKACEIARKAGANFVKTATGFGPMGATIHHVKIMREIVGKEMGVKAAGGIRNFKDALRMIAAGADRIGTSTGVDIIESYRKARQHGIKFEIEEIPCKLCPVTKISAEAVPKEIYTYYKNKCLECKYQDIYNKFTTPNGKLNFN